MGTIMKLFFDSKSIVVLSFLSVQIVNTSVAATRAIAAEDQTVLISDKLPSNSHSSPHKGNTDTACLAQLKRATQFRGRYTGYGLSQTKDFLAYEKALALGGKIRKEVEDLLVTGSPAGRLYAAILLERLDPKAGRKALENMLSDNSIVTFGFYGCGGTTGPLWRIAKVLIDRPTVRINNFEKVDSKSVHADSKF